MFIALALSQPTQYLYLNDEITAQVEVYGMPGKSTTFKHSQLVMPVPYRA
jgi:6-phosphogluconolactonase (cycloisomerase 2 family)